MIIIKRNSCGVCYGIILNGGPWTHELHVCKLPEATCQYSPAHLFSKEKRKVWIKKMLLPQNIKKQKENGKQKKKRLFCPHCHHTHLLMPHIKQACLQTTDYKSQTKANCNPEMSIKTCIRMVKKNKWSLIISINYCHTMFIKGPYEMLYKCLL